MEGDQSVESFDESFERLFRHAHGIAFGVLRDREEAEDVAMEALTRACCRWSKLQPRPDPWVGTVALNLSVDRWRRLRRRPSQSPPAPVAEPYGERIDLLRAIRRLPKGQRQVVAARYLLDYSESNTAKLLECSTGTVKQHLARAWSSLRSSLKDDSEGRTHAVPEQ